MKLGDVDRYGELGRVRSLEVKVRLESRCIGKI